VLYKDVREAAVAEGITSRARHPQHTVLRLLANTVLPEWSKDASDSQFANDLQPKAKDYRQAQIFINSPHLVKLGPGFYAFFQSRKERLSPLSKKRALQVLDMYEMADWDPTLYRVMCYVHFTTSEVCFPCDDWEDNQFCSHMMGVRELEGHPPLGKQGPTNLSCHSQSVSRIHSLVVYTLATGRA
jgi:hypothetical protein